MMNRKFLLLGLVAFGCSEEGPLKEVRLTNPANVDREEVVSIDVSDWNVESFDNLVMKSENETIPYERVDSDADGTVDEVRFVATLASGATKTYSFTEGEAAKPEKLTQAELSIRKGGEWQDRKYVGGEFENVQSLRVPEAHTDHSYFIRYEGPGWESNLVGYRFYLDWRNGIDIFGKKTEDLVLQQVGQDNFDSYHEESDWGLDVLKVGSSLGLGSIGRHLNDSLYRFQEVDSVYAEISENGLLQSAVTTQYYDWKTENDSTDLTSVLSIEGESRVTQHQVKMSNPISGFCTGLVKNEGEEFINVAEGDFRLLATYGDFSLNNDQLGMAVIVRNDQVDQLFDDEFSHVVTFKPLNEITYYFLAAWEKEPEGLKSFEGFKMYVTAELTRFNNPISVEEVN